jgi:c-di-GMP-binding flagellar brake protein YcgR
MSWDGGNDRRKYKRVNLRLLLEFEDGAGGPCGDKARMETINFSAGGFYCRFNRKTPPLTRLALRFVFPPFGSDHQEERALNCEAVVVRCEPEPGAACSYRVAACFTNLSNEDRTYIQDYLEWYEVVFAESDAEPGSANQPGEGTDQPDEEVA